MGLYDRSDRVVNGAALYTMSLVGDDGRIGRDLVRQAWSPYSARREEAERVDRPARVFFLYRSSATGGWLVTDQEDEIAANGGDLESPAADLPSKAGLGWRHGTSAAVDLRITCFEVRTAVSFPQERREEQA